MTIEELNLEEIKKITQEFFEKMQEEVSIENISFKENSLFLDLKSEEPDFLIGEKGQNLFSIQHLLRKILIKKTKNNFYLNLDINDYKKKKIERLKMLIKETADEVSLTKEERELPVMTSYERRIAHLEITKRSDVASYSVGEGQDRRVVIKPSA